MDKIYYESQENWSEKEFYYLHRVLHRLLFYYDKYTEEIAKMDLAQMSQETKVLIYCIIKYYHKEELFDKYENLKPLKDIQPLEKQLVIDSNPLPEDNIYKQMNVVY